MYQTWFAVNLCCAAINLAGGNTIVFLLNMTVAGLMWKLWYDEERDKAAE